MKRLILILIISFYSVLGNTQTVKHTSDIEQVVKAIKFYPNPAVSVINFEFQKSFDKGLTLQIYNFVGKKIFEVSSLTSKTSIDLAEFYRGVYIFQLRDKSGRIIESGKFQVIK